MAVAQGVAVWEGFLEEMGLNGASWHGCWEGSGHLLSRVGPSSASSTLSCSVGRLGVTVMSLAVCRVR